MGLCGRSPAHLGAPLLKSWDVLCHVVLCCVVCSFRGSVPLLALAYGCLVLIKILCAFGRCLCFWLSIIDFRDDLRSIDCYHVAVHCSYLLHIFQLFAFVVVFANGNIFT